MSAVLADDGGGRLPANLMHFARTLRAAGLAVGPGRVIEAVRAVQAVGLRRRDDFYWTLHAVFVQRAGDRELFDQVFHVFWRNPHLLERIPGIGLPAADEQAAEAPAESVSRRAAEALAPVLAGESRPAAEDVLVERDAVLTWSDQEALRHRDFDAMSADEVAQARRLIARLRLGAAPVATRRLEPHPRGRSVHLRRTLRRSLRGAHGLIALEHARRRRRPPPLVLLCDVSGSMGRYSRMLLHFAHTVTGDRERVESFVFGTHLTRITRQLRDRDVDVALTRVGQAVSDWDGGTRIGQCLHVFNRDWSRRVLGQGAVVLFVTDGLDRDAGDGLGAEMERLHKSCRRLICLNPLLRYDGYQPRARGMQAILPHVDEFRSIHNLESMAGLVAALSAPAPGRGADHADRGDMVRWLKMLD